MRQNRRTRYMLSVLSGCLLTLSFPYAGSFSPLIFVAFIPILLIQNEEHSSNFHVFLHGFIAFFLFNIGTTWWIWNSTAIGSMMAFFLNALFMAITFLVFHCLSKPFQHKAISFLLIPVWLGYEFLHLRWELSWPWLSLGNTFSLNTSWVQRYEYTGILGGSTWVLLCNILI